MPISVAPSRAPATASGPTPQYLPGYAPSGGIRWGTPLGSVQGGGLGSSPSVAQNLLLKQNRPTAQAGPASFQPAQQLMGQSLGSKPAGASAYNYNYTPQYTGKVTSMPYGQYTSSTLNQLANATGQSRSALNQQISGLAPGMLGTISAIAQRSGILSTPGDGQGVNPHAFAAPRTLSLNTPSPNPAVSSFSNTMNQVQQGIGGNMPANMQGLGQSPAAQPSSLSMNQPLDPFGTQASGGQYGNLSGTPAIFGASNYGGPGPGTLNTSPEAQAILARTKAAAMGNFNQGLNVMGQPTTAGQSGPQLGQTVGDLQWNGTSWVMRDYGAPPQGVFGGSNPGGYGASPIQQPPLQQSPLSQPPRPATGNANLY